MMIAHYCGSVGFNKNINWRIIYQVITKFVVFNTNVYQTIENERKQKHNETTTNMCKFIAREKHRQW